MRWLQLKWEEASGFPTLNRRIEDDRSRSSDPCGGFFRIFQDFFQTDLIHLFDAGGAAEPRGGLRLRRLPGAEAETR